MSHHGFQTTPTTKLLLRIESVDHVQSHLSFFITKGWEALNHINIFLVLKVERIEPLGYLCSLFHRVGRSIPDHYVNFRG